MIERTLVLLKPDAVKRGVMGEIIARFEKVGMKIVACRLAWVDAEKAKEHYTEDITVRRGEHVRNQLVDFITSGPVLAMVIEGVDAIENVRIMVGVTEPKANIPGTIRGDYSHVSFSHADSEKKVVANLVHASSDKADAEREILVWFRADEIFDYETIYQAHTM
ncbi:MAG: nucleoside-diphosphate kinase [Candidatus Buchananbacteria bacterium]|jgi:nucleoside-diphosphate kinase